jgi:16S rRNA G1207 methylase RsmC
MDVLREIQQAEERADEIERSFREKAEETKRSVALQLQQERARLEQEAARDREAREKEMQLALAAQKDDIVTRATEEREALRKAAKAGEARAVELIRKKLGL